MRHPTCCSLLALAVLAGFASAQQAPLASRLFPSVIDSGRHDNVTAQPLVAFEQFVNAPRAPWMRLRVDTARLPAGSYLEVVNARDGFNHRLDAAELSRWNMTSCYFNGDLFLVRLVIAPGAVGASFTTSSVEVGVDDGAAGPLSQCGPVDDRIPSADPRAGRLLTVGCTAWLISSTSCFATAGHCCAGTTSVVEFNVPPSSSTGTIQHPPPQDQYSVDAATKVFENGGVGLDWCLFKVFRNATTNRFPGQVQNRWFALSPTVPQPPRTIRVTGYGVDNDNRDRTQTQQTHTGSLSTAGASLCYVVDTEGGNSGSPVIDEATNTAIGVHTHGGCSTSGTGCNSGTPVNYAPFQAALRSLTCGTTGGFTVAGAGCTGSNGVDTISAAGIFRVGQAFTVSLAGGGSTSVGFLCLGASDTSWNSVPLPLSLAPAGAPGCTLYVSLDVLSPVATSAVGAANVTMFSPADAALVGAVVFFQWLDRDTGANALGMTSSNYGRLVLGS